MFPGGYGYLSEMLPPVSGRFFLDTLKWFGKLWEREERCGGMDIVSLESADKHSATTSRKTVSAFIGAGFGRRAKAPVNGSEAKMLLK